MSTESQDIKHIGEIADDLGQQMLARMQNMTPEERQRRNHERVKWEQDQKENDVADLRRHMGAPKRHLACEVKNDGEWGKKLELLTDKLGTGFIVALVGIRGNGKTQMAVNLMKRNTLNLRTAKFCTATEFFMEIKGTYRRDAQNTEEEIVSDYRKPKLLVIDEIGKRGESEWENTLLFELLNKRYNDMTDTVLIDNRTVEEFQTAIGPSLASRISESGGIIHCDWESFR